MAVTNAFGRAAILAVATAIALGVAPGVARRGLTSTAETLAAVGLVLLPMTLYALHGNRALGGTGGRRPGLPRRDASLITAVAAFLYAGVTRLAAPRYATVMAVQPVPPLLAYPVIESPAGWALALTAVALVDLLLLTTVIRERPAGAALADRPAGGRPTGRAWPRPTPGGSARRTSPAATPTRPIPARTSPDAPPRPESRPRSPT